MIDDAKIREWAQLEANATPGPWYGEDVYVCGPDDRILMTQGDDIGKFEAMPNKSFVVAAREAIPLLLAERAQLIEALERLQREKNGALARLADEIGHAQLKLAHCQGRIVEAFK